MEEIAKYVTPGSVAAVIGTLWLLIHNRQTKRLDDHDNVNTKQNNDISILDKKVEGIGMHLGVHKSEVLDHVIRLEGDHDEIKSAMLMMKEDTDKRIEALDRNTDKKIEATNKIFERHITTLIEVLQDK
jgi:hypothetical protein